MLLAAWFYLCVYFVQRVHFSPLVPSNYKAYANMVTLFTGPFLLLTLFLLATARQTRQTRERFWDVLKREIRKAVQALRSRQSRVDEDETALRLLASVAASTRSTGTATPNARMPRRSV
jgi:hypothetical protein